MSLVCRAIVCLIVLVSASAARGEYAYDQRKDVVFAEAHGIGLVMDIFVPTQRKNGLAIIDVASGAWSSSRGKIEDHKIGQTYNILCIKGYTVFAIRPGSATKFSAMEMVDNMHTGIRWVRSHAQEFGIDPDRLGMTGASAGGHIALLTAIYAKEDTRVKALGIFFPPTDFLNWGTTSVEEGARNERIQKVMRQLAVPYGEAMPSDEEVLKRVAEMSPARNVKPDLPPLLLFHGDADPLVPLQQSRILVEACEKAGVPVQLHIKPGGGHPWLTIFQEVAVMANWFDEQLGVTPQSPLN